MELAGLQTLLEVYGHCPARSSSLHHCLRDNWVQLSPPSQPYRNTTSADSFHCGIAAQESLSRSGQRILRRRHYRKLNQHALANRRSEGHLAWFNLRLPGKGGSSAGSERETGRR